MNSVVTVYILIPFLLIPQLLLSGVVVKFDQLNKTIRNEIDVPIMGDLMVSRWALEASLVEQFINNEFEKNFYDVDQQITANRYTTVYLLPTIETLLREGFESVKQDNTNKEGIEKLRTVEYEINKLLSKVGPEQLPVADQLTAEAITTEVLDQSIEFLRVYKTYILNKQAELIGQKDAIIAGMIADGSYEKLKQAYQNEVVGQTVTNGNSLSRIVRKDGKLHRLADPVYNSAYRPDNLLDYRAPLYVPVKHFLGFTMSTTYFNILVIWFMTLILMLALYNNWLKKFFKLFEKQP